MTNGFLKDFASWSGCIHELEMVPEEKTVVLLALVLKSHEAVVGFGTFLLHPSCIWNMFSSFYCAAISQGLWNSALIAQ